MPVFSYKAVDRAGGDIIGEITANGRSAAIIELERRGLSVFEISADQAKKSIPSSRRRLFFNRALNDSELVDLSEAMAELLANHLSLEAAIDIVARTTTSSRTRHQMEALSSALHRGQPLHQAIAEQAGAYPPEFRSMIASGDKANRLSKAFEAAARYQSGRANARLGLLSALAYPTFLLAAGLGVFAIILFYLTPTLYSVLSDDLSRAVTIRRLEALRLWLAANYPLLIAFVVGGAATVFHFRRWVRTQLLWLCPPLKNLQKVTEWGQIARLLHVLLSSGTTLDVALDTISKLRRDVVSTALLTQSVEELRQGATASQTFEGETTVPIVFQCLFAVGEEANTLPEMMTLAATRLETTRETELRKLVGLVTPVATLVIGGLIASLVWVLIDAILEVSQIAV